MGLNPLNYVIRVIMSYISVAFHTYILLIDYLIFSIEMSFLFQELRYIIFF